MADKRRIPPQVFENRRILFRNLSGKQGRFTPAGKRTFSLLLEPDEAAAMLADGWNIKYLKAREEGDEPQAHVEVEARYSEKSRPPRIVLLTGRGRTDLDEDTIGMIDYADIEQIDMTINPSHWVIQEGTPNEKSGIKAYLNSMYVTIREDPLEAKYADVRDAGPNAMDDAADETPF